MAMDKDVLSLDNSFREKGVTDYGFVTEYLMLLETTIWK